jgi:transcriptional regulator with XRE-family HTH domain
MRPSGIGVDLGRRLRRWRIASGLRQGDVAEYLTQLRGWRVYPHQISVWERSGKMGGASKQMIEELLSSSSHAVACRRDGGES